MTLAELDALLATAAARGVNEVSVDGQSAKFMTVSELLELRKHLTPAVSAYSLLGNRTRLIPAAKE